MKRLILLRKEQEDKRFGIQKNEEKILELLQIIAEEICKTNVFLERIPNRLKSGDN
jgi:hypothetical protein